MTEGKTRNHCFDLIKGIACIFVVFMHCEFPGYLGVFVQSISRFSVPFFFMISGYFCWREGGADFGKKIRHIGFILLGTIAFYLVVTPLYQPAPKISAVSLVKWLVFNVPPYIAPQLWFLFALLYDYILFALSEKLKLRRFSYLAIPVGVFLYIALAQGAHLLGFSVPNLVYRNFLIEGYPFFALGFWIHEHQDRIGASNKALIWTLAVTTLLCPVERLLMGRDFGVNIVSFVQVTALFLIGANNPGVGKKNPLSVLGARYSMYVYILHPAVMHLLTKLRTVVHLGENTPLDYAMPVLCVAFSLLFAAAAYHLGALLRKRRSA